MSNWIDRPGPYPWSNPLARDLQRRLVDTFWDREEVRTLVRSADAPDWQVIDWQGSPSQLWIRVLDKASAEQSLRELLVFIARKERVGKHLTQLLEELLAGRQPPADPAPGGGADGMDFDAGVSKEEALLFGDDLSESVGEIPELLDAVGRVMQLRGAVCRLLVTAADGSLWNGTGTLITGNRVLTNYHVLFPRGKPCIAVAVEFNLERDASGQSMVSTVVQGDLAVPAHGSAADDWALVPVPAVEGIVPVDILVMAASPVVGERAFILQHPDGSPKRLAFVRNRIVSVTAMRAYYLTDTRGGSSGSPVFNARGKLIALHRAGGEPRKLPGADPVKKNEGVRMDMIAPQF